MLLGRLHGGARGSGARRGRWTAGARRARAIAIAFRWVWPCWSRAGSRSAQLRTALEAQKAAGAGRLGDWLVRQQGVERGDW